MRGWRWAVTVLGTIAGCVVLGQVAWAAVTVPEPPDHVIGAPITISPAHNQGVAPTDAATQRHSSVVALPGRTPSGTSASTTGTTSAAVPDSTTRPGTTDRPEWPTAPAQPAQDGHEAPAVPARPPTGPTTAPTGAPTVIQPERVREVDSDDHTSETESKRTGTTTESHSESSQKSSTSDASEDDDH